MTNIEWKQVVQFVCSLCNATINETLVDGIKELDMKKALILQKAYPIPKNLYKVDGEVLAPTRRAITMYHQILSCPGNVIVPYKIYDDNGSLGVHIMSDRATTDDRWDLLGSMCDFVRENSEFDDYSDKQYAGLVKLVSLYQATIGTTSQKKLMENVRSPEEE
jgi:hypothetical protein